MASAYIEKNWAKASRLPALKLALGIATALLAGAAAQSGAAPAVTAAPLWLAPAITLSDQTSDFERTAKSRLARLANSTLVAVYGDAVADDPTDYVYDLKADEERPARDIFVRTCDSAGADCADPRNWTAPVNISNTAALSSIDTNWTGDTDGSAERTPFHGDSGKPNIFSSGDRAVVTWVDQYCPGDGGQPTAQRTVTYLERNDREVPFSCIYAAHAGGNGVAGDWTVTRLSDGSRDANQDVSRGMQNGGWAVIWQEDPRGLQPGEAEGPGDGASGARVSLGTDVWYTYSGPSKSFGDWQPPVRLTDNWTTSAGKPGGGPGGSGGGCQDGGSGGGHGAGGGGCQDGGPSGATLAQAAGDAHDGGEEEEQNPVKDADGNPVARGDIETGSAGASRPNLGLMSNTAIVAYEETKGAGGGQGGAGPDGETAGKFVRYHQFPFQSPPADEIGQAGCIISDPEENGRRVRLVTQGEAGASGLRWAIFWRQGIGGQGASADIVLRLGTTEFAPANLSPAVDPGCATSVYEEAVLLDNADPLNVSSNTPIATDANLADATGANSMENARAHRALLRGDDLYVGYTYTGDDALAQLALPRANYNFWMRRFEGVTGTWMPPKNLSGIRNRNVDAKEPRLMGTPGDGPDCPTDPADCRDTSVFFAAWGTERKDPVTGEAEDLDIFVTYTTDKGGDFVPAIRIARGDNVNDQAEDQMRSTPDGSRVFSVWNEQDRTGADNARFTVGTMARSLGPRGGP